MSKSGSSEQHRLPTPGSLEAKMKLLALLPYDERARRKHCLVFGFIVDWWHKDYGDALASSRFVASKLEERRHQIPNGKGLSAPQAHVVMADLADWGFLVKARGKGRWANRYIPNWSLVCSANSEGICATPVGNAIGATSIGNDCASASGSTNRVCATTGGNEDPFTRPGQRPGDGLNGNHNSHAALSGNGAPAFAGAVPEGARVVPEAQSGFEEFWAVYPKKIKRAKARAAYEKVAPDADLLALIVEKAKELAAHHKEHETDFKWIKEPANWLAGECWEEDLPAAYGKPEPKAEPERKAKAAEKPTSLVPANSNVPIPRSAWQRVEIIATDVVGTNGNSELVATMSTAAGERVVDRITLEHASQESQEAGQKQFEQLRWAAGLGVIEDTADLHGIAFERRIRDGEPAYRAIKAEAA